VGALTGFDFCGLEVSIDLGVPCAGYVQTSNEPRNCYPPFASPLLSIRQAGFDEELHEFSPELG
jgi:hypothetical protein